MKKTLLLPFGALLMSALASCGGGSDKIVLKIGFWPEQSASADVAMYNVWKERFEADFPQYEIKGSPYTYSPETIGTKKMNKTLPDVFQTWFTEPEMLKNKKYIRDVTEQVKALGWDEKMDKGMRKTLTFDDKLYGVPRDGYGLGLLISKQILGDNNLLPEYDGGYSLYALNPDGTQNFDAPLYPQTWDEVRTICEEIAMNEEMIKGFMMYAANKNGGWVFSNIAWNYGATLEKVDDSGKVIANLDDPGAVEALTMLKELYWDELTTRTTNAVYDDWKSAIGTKVAMAVVGSDVVQEAKLSGGIDMDTLAFVPLPSGKEGEQYSLYGGTPFVFNSDCTDEQVEGILRFFDYIGRSPTTNESNFLAKKEGYEVAVKKAQPILPSINPWIDPEYLEKNAALEKQYVNVSDADYGPFFRRTESLLRTEEPYCTQEMYKALDGAIQTIFTDQKADPKAQLTTAKATLQSVLDREINS